MAGRRARLRSSVGASYPTVPAQWLFRVLEVTQPGSTNYCEVRRFVGDLRPAALETAVRSLAKRHEILTCGLPRVDRQAGDNWTARYTEYRQVADTDAPIQIDECEPAELSDDAPFRMARAPLWRVRFAQLDERSFALAIHASHAITDFWSQTVLWNDLSVLYGEALGLHFSALPPAPSFGAWAEAQYEQRISGGWERSTRYWTEHLRGTQFPAFPDANTTATGRDHVALVLTDEQHVAIRALSAQSGGSAFAVVLGLFVRALAHEFDWSEVVLGCPFANRRDRSLFGAVGVYANIVLLRFTDPLDLSVPEMITEAWRRILRTVAHGHVTLDAIGAATADRDLARHQLLGASRVAVRQLGLGPAEPGSTTGLVPAPDDDPTTTPADYGFETTLLLDCWLDEDRSCVRLTFDRSMLDHDAVHAMLGHLIDELLAGVDAEAGSQIGN